MTRPPRIAVIIPCFNDGSTVEEAMSSARRQEPCEIVVVNDGSTDRDTLRVFKRLEDEGVAVVHQANQGLAAARMAGVRATKAPFVFPLDADDFLTPDSLTPLADALEEDATLDLAWGRYRFVGEKTHEKSLATELDPWLLTYLNDMPPGTMIRRQTLEEVGGWQPVDAYEDWDLWLAVAEHHGRGRGLAHVVYCYRLHGIRMCRESIPRHAELHRLLRDRHAPLFESRRQTRRASNAPRGAKMLLPLIDALWPGYGYRKAWLIGAIWHVFNGRGGYVRPLVRAIQRIARQTSAPRSVATGSSSDG